MTLTASPRLLKAGLAIADQETGAIERVIPLQYNPQSLSRSFQVKDLGEEATRSQALRLSGPPVETISIEATLDATDALERGEPPAIGSGIASHLAAIELLISPSLEQLRRNAALAGRGALEILPMIQPLTLFVWSRSRVQPVRISELSVTEEAFDPNLNPIRAKMSLSMRVLTVDDLGFETKGGALFLDHMAGKERLAAIFPRPPLDVLGLGGTA
jgi:hypothetical protein